MNCPITYRAEGLEPVVLLGGRPITNFVPHAGHILRADLRSQGWQGDRFRVLVFRGQRQELARRPNHNPNDLNGGDWAYVDGQRISMYDDSPGDEQFHQQNRHLDFWQRNAPERTRRVQAKPEDMRAWARPTDAEVSIFPRFNWSHYLLPVESFDAATRTFRLRPGSFYEIRPGDRYFVRNLLEELDAPGEWYLDMPAGVLYFWPPAPVGNEPVVAAPLPHLVRLKRCGYVTFQGFTFECCDDTAIVLEDCTHCTIAASTIRNVGDATGSGIVVKGGRANRIVGNDIYAVGRHGIVVDGGDPMRLEPGGHRIENNVIHHVGRVGRDGNGVQLQGSGHHVAHNLICYTPAAGIMVWGNRHLIEFNRIHHTCLESEDTGAIAGGAIDWVSWLGVVIRHNYIHDTFGFGYDPWAKAWRSPYFAYAVYPDWAASHVQITGNILARAGAALIYLHSGRHNRIENNVLVDGAVSQVDWTGWTSTTGFWSSMVKGWIATYQQAAAHPVWRQLGLLEDPQQVPLPNGQVMHGNVLRRNIVYYLDEGAALFRFQNLPFDRNESDSNLVYHAGLPLRTGYPALRREYGLNLLNNGGLEESAPGDFPRGWGWAPAQESGTRVQVVEHPCHGGQRALLVEPPPLPTNGVLPQPVYLTFGHIPFQPGKAYRLSVWLRAEQPDTAVTLGVFSWKKNLHSWQRQSRCSLRPQWQQFELIFRLPQPGKPEYQATMDLRYWRLEIAPDTGRFWLDDVALREAELTDEWEGWQARGMDGHSLVADPCLQMVPGATIGCGRTHPPIRWAFNRFLSSALVRMRIPCGPPGRSRCLPAKPLLAPTGSSPSPASRNRRSMQPARRTPGPRSPATWMRTAAMS